MSTNGNGPDGTGVSRAGTVKGRPRRLEVVHRGVRWRRSVGGTITWLNEGLGQWVTWYPGSDAPPVPPGWVPEDEPVTSGVPGVGATAGKSAAPAGAAGTPAGTALGARATGRAGGRLPGAAAGRPPEGDNLVQRHPMRSPYRMAPVAIAIIIVALALWQATQSPVKATAADVAAAEALKGQCLAQTGGTASQPKYSPTPVDCSSAAASVKVVAVVVPHSKAKPRNCPAGAGIVQVLQPGIMDEPVECTQPVKHGK